MPGKPLTHTHTRAHARENDGEETKTNREPLDSKKEERNKHETTFLVHRDAALHRGKGRREDAKERGRGTVGSNERKPEEEDQDQDTHHRSLSKTKTKTETKRRIVRAYLTNCFFSLLPCLASFDASSPPQKCKTVCMQPIKRCKHFEIGGDKKKKGGLFQ